MFDTSVAQHGNLLKLSVYFCKFLDQIRMFCAFILGHKTQTVCSQLFAYSNLGELRCSELSPVRCSLQIQFNHQSVPVIQWPYFDSSLLGISFSHQRAWLSIRYSSKTNGRASWAHAGVGIHYSKAVQRDAERGLPSLSIIQLSHHKPLHFPVFPAFSLSISFLGLL